MGKKDAEVLSWFIWLGTNYELRKEVGDLVNMTPQEVTESLARSFTELREWHEDS